jgi:hypothetical protein
MDDSDLLYYYVYPYSTALLNSHFLDEENQQGYGPWLESDYFRCNNYRVHRFWFLFATDHGHGDSASLAPGAK